MSPRFRKIPVKNTVNNRPSELRSFQPSALAAMVHLAVLACSLGVTPAALAGPQGGHIAGGVGSISKPNAATTVIKQNSNNLIINWNSFDVGKNEKVQFIQPSATATALNRIYSRSASQIFGSVTANGRIILLNGNGFLIGPSATLNLGSLVVSNLDISNADFMANRFKLTSTGGEGRIVNQGMIKASSGSVALIGNSVSNEGVIVANAGTVTLASGKAATLDFSGDGLLRVEVTESVIKNAAGVADGVLNNGEIRAGQVLLTAKAAQDVFNHVVNNEGLIRATKIDTSGGVIRLVGAGGETVDSGELNASGSRGGRIEVLGDKVALTDTAKLDASATQGAGGKILVGGDFHGEGAIKTASVTRVADGATINADAGVKGDGGQVAVWADGTTHFGGSISAKGGAASGNGGFAEVSGKQLLDLKASAKVDLTAKHGQKGTLLLDPANITIQADSPDLNGDGTLGDDFAHSDDLDQRFADFLNANSVITANALAGFLNTTNVTLAATNDITLVAGTTLSWGGGHQLTLTADHDINLAGTITTTVSTDTGSSLLLKFGNALNVTGNLSGFTGGITVNGGSASTIVGGAAYTINGADSGVATLGGNNQVVFTNVQNLAGTSGDDTFAFAIGGSLSGNIDGLGGADSVVIQVGANQHVSDLITAINNAVSGSISNIETQTVAGTGSGILTLDAGGNASITGANAGTATTLTSGWGWSGFGSLTGSSGSNTFTLSGGSLSGTITGGGGNDTLVGSTAYVISGTNIGTAASVAGGFSGIENLTGTSNSGDTFTLSGGRLSGTIDGGGGNDTLVGSRAYVITGANSGTALNNSNSSSLTFSNIQNLTGTSNTDTFTLSGGSLSGTITGGGGSDTLIGSTAYAITGTNSGTALNNIGGGSLTFTGIQNLTGTSGSDTFIFSNGGGVSGTVNGGGGTDSVTIQTGQAARTVSQLNTAISNAAASFTNATWTRTVTGTGSGTLTLDLGGGATITAANAGTATTLASGWDWSGFGSLVGDAGANTFTFNVGGSLSGSLDGSGGTDLLVIQTGQTDLTVSQLNTAINNIGAVAASITNIETRAIAGAGTLTLDLGGDANITGVNAGTATTLASGWGWSGFSNLTGDAGANTFTLSGGSLSGTITGGGGNDTLIGSAAYNITGANSGTALNNIGGGSLTFSGIQNLTGTSGNDTFTLSPGGSLSGAISGGSGNDTLAGSTTYTITGANSGTATGIGSGFTGIQNLTGTSGNDSFTFANSGSLSGNVNGGGGADSVTIQTGQAARTVSQLNTAISNAAGSFTNAGTWTRTVAGAGSGTLTLDLGGNASITGANAGTATTLASGWGWSGFSGLAGDAGANIFTLSGGSLSGAITGGGGNDTLIGSTTYVITGVNSGTAAGVAGGFSGIQNLTGSSGNDTFTVNAGGSLTGVLDGGAGSDTVLAGADGVTVWMGTNIETISANGHINLTLAGASTYVITGVDAGSANGAAFNGFKNLTGTAGNDTFTFNSGGSLTGAIDGGAGTDSLIGSTAYILTGVNSGTAARIGGGFTGIENLTGTSGNDTFTLSGGSLSGTITGGGGNDTLIGSTTYVITGANSGTAAGIASGFAGIQNLTGSAGDDTFTLSGGSLSGAINGGGGNDTLIGSTTYVITGANSGTATGVTGGFAGIQSLTGTTGNDTFTLLGGSLSGMITGAGGNDTLIGSTTYVITGANSGTAAGVGSFAGIQNLTGTSGNDTFTLSGGSLSGKVTGGGGNDTLVGSTIYVITGANNGTAAGVAGGFTSIQNLTGSAGNDTFTLSGGSLSGAINGGGGNDTLIGSTNYTITGVNSGTAKDNIAGGFSNIQNLTGTSGDDTFTLSGGSLSGTIAGAGGNNTLEGSTAYNITDADSGTALNNSGSNSLTFSDIQNLTGRISGNTTFTLSGKGSLKGSIAGQGANNTLVGSTKYVLDGTDSGTADGVKRGFTDIQNLTGRSGAVNEFDLSKPKAFLSGKIDGGSANSNNVLAYSPASPQPTGTNGANGSGFVLINGQSVHFTNIYKTQLRLGGENQGTANTLAGPVNADAARNDNSSLFVIESSFFDPSLQIFSVVDTGVALPCDQSESGGCGSKVQAQQSSTPANFQLIRNNPVATPADVPPAGQNQNWLDLLKVNTQSNAQNNKTKIPLASL